MTQQENYWTGLFRRRLSRRQALKKAGLAGLGLVGAGIVGCSTTPAQPTPSSGSARLAPTPSPAATAIPRAKSVVDFHSSVTAQTTVSRGGTLTVAMKAEPSTLDPLTSTSGWDLFITRCIYNILVNTGNKFEIAPDLAESWEQPDNLIIVFKLRKGIKFHDGTDFNADAVVEHMGNRAFNPPPGMPAPTTLKSWLKSVEKADDYTVKATLVKPYAPAYTDMSMGLGMISSPTAVKKYGGDPREYGRLGPVGTGPFKFVEWVPGDHVTIVRNENYWEKDAAGNTLPYFDKVIIKPMTDEVVKIAALKSGTLDIIDDVPFADKAGVETNTNLVVKGEWLQAGMSLNFNCGKPPFNDKNLRQAIAWAMDPEAFHRAIYFGVGQAGQSPIPPSDWAHNPDIRPYKRDLNKAKELLAKAGVPQGLKFRYMCYREYESKIGQILQQQLAPLGLEITIDMLAHAEMASRKDKNEFDTFPQGIVPARDPSGYMTRFHSRGSIWVGKWANAKVDELLDKATTIYNQAERKKLYDEAQTIVVEECPSIAFHYENRMVGMTKKVQNYYAHPDGYMRYNYVWLSK